MALAAVLAAAAPAAAEPPPDPGGDEQAVVSLPPPGGRSFGFNDLSPLIPSRNVPAATLAHLTRAAGANIHRITVNWQSVEPERDVWSEVNWDRYTGLASAFRAQGQRLLVTLSPAPIWARDTGFPRACITPVNCRYPPAEFMLGEWAEYVAEVVRRIPDAVIETWNEPNLDVFWRPRPQPERWARLHATTYWAAKSVDPGTTVLAGGIAGTATPDGGQIVPIYKFLSRAYATGRLNHTVDALSTHIYTNNSVAMKKGTVFAGAFHDVRRVRNENGDANKPIWLTETGLSTSGGWALSHAEQARGLIRRYKRVMTMPDVDGLILHTAIDQQERHPNDPGYGFGVLGSVAPLAVKASYCEFAGRASANPPGGCPRIVDEPPGGDDDGSSGGGDDGIPAAVLDIAERRCATWSRTLHAYRDGDSLTRARLVARCVTRYLAVRAADLVALKSDVVTAPRDSCRKRVRRVAKRQRRLGRAITAPQRAAMKKRCTGRRSIRALNSAYKTL
jgi:hypothetical protein